MRCALERILALPATVRGRRVRVADAIDRVRGEQVQYPPETGADLMSQPTLSRLENVADWRALARIGLGQLDLYCRSFARAPSRIVLDIDDTVTGSVKLTQSATRN